MASSGIVRSSSTPSATRRTSASDSVASAMTAASLENVAATATNWGLNATRPVAASASQPRPRSTRRATDHTPSSASTPKPVATSRPRRTASA